jgi:hypothetical protein
LKDALETLPGHGVGGRQWDATDADNRTLL